MAAEGTLFNILYLYVFFKTVNRLDRMWTLSSADDQHETGIDIPGVDAGLYQSRDRGMAWQRIELDLNHYVLYPLGVHPDRKNELFVETVGLGAKRVILIRKGLSKTIEPRL